MLFNLENARAYNGLSNGLMKRKINSIVLIVCYIFFKFSQNWLQQVYFLTMIIKDHEAILVESPHRPLDSPMMILIRKRIFFEEHIYCILDSPILISTNKCKTLSIKGKRVVYSKNYILTERVFITKPNIV